MKLSPLTIVISEARLARQYKFYLQACKDCGVKKPLSLGGFTRITGYKAVPLKIVADNRSREGA